MNSPCSTPLGGQCAADAPNFFQLCEEECLFSRCLNQTNACLIDASCNAMVSCVGLKVDAAGLNVPTADMIEECSETPMPATIYALLQCALPNGCVDPAPSTSAPTWHWVWGWGRGWGMIVKNWFTWEWGWGNGWGWVYHWVYYR